MYANKYLEERERKSFPRSLFSVYYRFREWGPGYEATIGYTRYLVMHRNPNNILQTSY